MRLIIGANIIIDLLSRLRLCARWFVAPGKQTRVILFLLVTSGISCWIFPELPWVTCGLGTQRDASRLPACSKAPLTMAWPYSGFIFRISTLPACCSCSVRTSSSDVTFFCSDGIHAVCGRLLRAAALHVLPDPSERAHLSAEEQAPHGSLWVQRLLYQLRPFSRSGTSSCSPTEAAAAGEWRPSMVSPGRTHRPPRSSFVLAAPVPDRLWWWEDVLLVLPHHAPCPLVNVFLGGFTSSTLSSCAPL